MISAIRNNMGTKMFRYFLWAALLAIPGGTLLVGLTTRFTGNAKGVVAVNGYTIMSNEIQRKAHVVELRIQSIRSQFGAFAENILQSFGMTEDPTEIALREKIQEKLLLSVADSAGLSSLSQDYIAEKLADPAFALQYLHELIPKELFNANGELDKNMLLKFLQRQGLSINDFEDQIETILKQFFVMQLIKVADYVPLQSSAHLNRQSTSRREFFVIPLKISDYAKKITAAGLEKKDVEKFFIDQNRLLKRYWVPEKRSAAVWTFKADEYGIGVSEKDSKAYFARNKKKFKNKKFTTVRKEIEALIRKDRFKRRFSADIRRMKRHLQNDSNAVESFALKHKGVKTIISSDEKKPHSLVSTKLFALTQSNKVGNVVQGSEGMLIILNKIEKSYQSKLADVYQSVEKDIAQERAVKQLENDAIELTSQLQLNANKDVIGKYNLQGKSYAFEGDDSSSWKKAQKEGLPIERMKRMTHKNAAIYDLSPDGAFLIQLNGISPVETITDTSSQELVSQFFIPAFVASLEKNASIVYSNQ